MNAYIGVALVLAGGMLVCWQKSRIFNRTNRFGVQQFESYSAKLKARTIDFIFKVTSMSLMGGGLFLIGLHFENSWGWIITVPVYLFVLYMVLGS